MKAEALVVAVSDMQADADAGRLKNATQGNEETEALVSNMLDAIARSCGRGLVDSLLDTLY